MSGVLTMLCPAKSCVAAAVPIDFPIEGRCMVGLQHPDLLHVYHEFQSQGDRIHFLNSYCHSADTWVVYELQVHVGSAGGPC